MSKPPANPAPTPNGQRRMIVAPTLGGAGPSFGKFLVVWACSLCINGSLLLAAIVILPLLGMASAAETEVQPAVEETTEVVDNRKEYDLTNTDFGEDSSLPLNYNVDRIEEVSVPGRVDPTAPVGLENAPEAAPMNIPPPPGAGGGTGAAVFDPNVSGVGSSMGTLGGMGGSMTLGGFGGRSGATRVKMLAEGGGNKMSEKAVADGLKFLALHQNSEGFWSLNNFNRDARTKPIPYGKVVPDNSQPGTTRNNNTAGTAFGLLPFLAAGITHKSSKTKGWLKAEVTVNSQVFPAGTDVDILGEAGTGFKCKIKARTGASAETTLSEEQVFATPDYSKGVGAAISYLINKQSKSGADRGFYGGDMYSHGLATIAMCEAFGLTSDPKIKISAQMALNYIESAQDAAGGGWRYAPRQAGDTSVTGWQLMALKSGQMSGLSVKRQTLKKVEAYLDSCEASSKGGYGYVPGSGESHTMTAVGALCRQYLGVNPRNPSLLASINRIKKMPPGQGGVYYDYYATQVMHHMGGEAWQFWNLGPDGTGKGGIRDTLIARQDKPQGGRAGQAGSFPGNEHVGGRLGATSLCLLSLEVYYRHLPLYRRDMGVMKAAGDK